MYFDRRECLRCNSSHARNSLVIGNHLARISLPKSRFQCLPIILSAYINRIQNEPQTPGELFRDLECELEALAISMQFFLEILTKISEIENVVKENKDILTIIAILSAHTKKELGFMCES